MNDPLVSVGIVTWNSARDLRACLAALLQQDYANLEFVVVDNASKDESVRIVQEILPTATIILNTENRGYCGGHNQGIVASHGAFYLPLNPDVIFEPGYITAMMEALESDENFGMAASCLYLGTKEDTPRRIDSTGLFLDGKRRQYLRGFAMVDEGQYRHMEEVFGVDGAAPLYRRSMLEDIQIDGQYFDEAFHSHKEDVDLAWRARIFGWRCIYTPDAIAYHRRHFKPGKRQNIAGEVKLHAVKNRFLLLLKNESSAGWRRDGIWIIFYDLQILVYLLFFERSSLKALWLVWQLRQRVFRWRSEIQKRAKASAQEQVSWFHPKMM